MSAWTSAAPGWWAREGDGYRTTAPLAWEIGRPGSGLWFAVPVGTAFDVTVPRALRWLVDRHEPRFLKAAALHDTMLGPGWSRLTAGAEFAEALRADGVGGPRRLAMWLAVSLWRWD